MKTEWQGDSEAARQMTEKRQTNGKRGRKKKGALVRNKRESDRAVGGMCCLSAQGERNVSFCAASVNDGCHYPTQWV